jgi:tetratricopeptide (TPR) repeat protein
MNTYPFASHNCRVDINSRFFRSIVESACRAVSHLQQSWQAQVQAWANRMTRQQPLIQPLISDLIRPRSGAALRQHALVEAQQGHHTEAILLFSHLIDCDPSNASDYSNRGLVYFQSGQRDAALTDYNRAIELNPRLDSAYNNRANYYAAQGQFLEAILDYDIALDLNPINVRAWINQGITFRELELYDRAIESFELALYLGKLEGHIYAERGRAYHLRGDWNCAVADYRRALTALPQSGAGAQSPSVRLRAQVERWLDELIGS